MDINDLYSYIRQNTTDDYDKLKNKIDEFSQEGLEPIRIYNIISQYIALKPFCRALDVINGDYIEFIKAIKIATFLKAKFNNENAISVMQKTLVYEDNNVCIFKPTNFQESSIIGEPICCFAYSQGRWDEHYNAYEEAIYYIFDVMRENSIHDFVAITVRPNGRALVLDKNHNWWSPSDSIRYIQGLGEGASTIVTKDGKSIKTENKQYNNMNKKLIRLTESDLQIVKETVKRVLKESNETWWGVWSVESWGSRGTSVFLLVKASSKEDAEGIAEDRLMSRRWMTDPVAAAHPATAEDFDRWKRQDLIVIDPIKEC